MANSGDVNQEFQSLFSNLEIEATQELIDEQKEALRDLELKLEVEQLEWAKLHVRRHVFGASSLTEGEKDALKPDVMGRMRDKIEKAKERLAKLEKHLEALTQKD